MLSFLTTFTLLELFSRTAFAAPSVQTTSPHANLAIARNINLVGFPNIAAADRARAKALTQHGLDVLGLLGGLLGIDKRAVASIPATNAVV
jgi:hypothetical protein